VSSSARLLRLTVDSTGRPTPSDISNPSPRSRLRFGHGRRPIAIPRQRTRVDFIKGTAMLLRLFIVGLLCTELMAVGVGAVPRPGGLGTVAGQVLGSNG